MTDLQTERLTLRPFSLELMKELSEGKERLGRAVGARVPPEWPGSDIEGALPFFMSILQDDPARDVWGVWLVAHTAERTIIGDVGYKGPPDDGTVEIGYSIVPSYRRRGYAVEAARALIDWAFAQPGVERITAEVYPDNEASLGVVAKLGMRPLGRVGDVLRWELTR